jgi:hypothetical protein
MLGLVEMGRILIKSITWVLIKWILECSRHEYIHTLGPHTSLFLCHLMS